MQLNIAAMDSITANQTKRIQWWSAAQRCYVHEMFSRKLQRYKGRMSHYVEIWPAGTM